jgi:hypothetical protein
MAIGSVECFERRDTFLYTMHCVEKFFFGVRGLVTALLDTDLSVPERCVDKSTQRKAATSRHTPNEKRIIPV